MHEYSVASEIVDIALKHAAGRRLTGIRLNIGKFSGVFRDPLTFYMDIILKEKGTGTIPVAVEQAPVQAICSCGTSYIAENMMAPCPSCGGFKRTISPESHQCTIDSIEVDDG